jgi:ABC-type branched-subunit amino acid transport system substrate-binding protein
MNQSSSVVAEKSAARQPQLKALGGLLLILILWLTSCVPVARPMIKIGLVAPFEGRYRDVGYEVIYAVRLAVREANAAGGVDGHSLALEALDDGGDPQQAAAQAWKLATDPEVVAVLGHWLEATTLAAAPAYAEERLPLLATSSGALPEGTWRLWLTDKAEQEAVPAGARLCPPPCQDLEDLRWLIDTRTRYPEADIYGPALWGLAQFAALAGSAAEGVYFIAPAPYPQDSGDPGFAERYGAISNGVAPRANAVLAYDGARLLIAAIARSLAEGGGATRAGIDEALRSASFSGLSGPISFDADGNWWEARGWVYQWTEGAVSGPARR